MTDKEIKSQKDGHKDKTDGQGQKGVTESLQLSLATESMDVFGTRRSLPRSPPQGPRHSRLNLVSQLKRCNSFNTGKKRKTLDSSMHEEYFDTEEVRKSEDPVVFVLAEAIELITKCSRDLDAKVAEFPNTQKEIKQIVMKLRKGAEVLNRDSTKIFLEKHKWHAVELPKYDADTQQETYQGIERRTFATQTNPTYNENSGVTDKEMEITELIDRNPDIETISKLVDKKWPKRVYRKTNIRKGINAREDQHRDIAFMLHKDQSDCLLTDKIKELCPVAKALLEEESNPNEITFGCCNRQITLNKKSNTMEEKRYTYLIPTTKGEGMEITKCTIETLKKYVEMVDVSSRRKTTLVIPTDSNIHQIRKVVECVAANADVDIDLVPLGPGIKDSIEVPPTQRTGERVRPRGILIRAGDKGYADTLKEVKNKVDIDSLGITVKNARKTAKGDLLITVRGGAEKTQMLSDAVRTNLAGTGIEVKKEEYTWYIYNMEATVTQEEILDALRREAKCEGEIKEKVTINDMWDSRDGSKIATVRVTRDVRDILKNLKSIKIGWVSCRIKEKVEIIRCYRCLEAGHAARNCKGPDRSEMCLKCGKSGHRAKDCKNSVFCILCNKEGHRITSINCGTYKNQVRRGNNSPI